MDLTLDAVPNQLAAHMRPLLPRLTELITEKIQDAVTPYAGPPGGRTHRMITTALDTAFAHFVDSVNGLPSTGRRVDEVFRALGRGEALQGRSLHAMREAYAIAVRDCWAELHRLALAHGMPVQVLGQLGDAVFRYVDQLDDRVTSGYAEAERAAAGSRRERLIRAILTGAGSETLTRLATAAGWPVPARVVPVLVSSFDGELAAPSPQVLVRRDEQETVVLSPAADFDAVLLSLRRTLRGHVLCVGWPVAVDEVGHALRWARRTLELVDLGVIAPAPVVHCGQHLTHLWLHAEPLLRRRACRHQLEPLLALTPHYRLVLAQTLCAWLETRDSAPVLAQRLAVHPQTVRNRLRRLRELFGDRLEDPEETPGITLALQASLPLWEAGHTDIDMGA